MATRKSSEAPKKKAPAPKRRSAKPAATKITKRGSSAQEEQRVHTPQVARSTRAPATTNNAPVAQQEERLPRKQTVDGSIPPGGTNTPAETAHSAAVLAHLAALKPGPRRFAIEYLKDHNATQAYIRAGYKATGNSAEVNAARLLRNAQVSAGIAQAEQEMLSQVQRDTGITLERTLREIARIGYFDPRKLFSKDGRPLEVTELDDDTAAVVAGLDVIEEKDGDGLKTGEVKKWKLADKKGALDMLMKHLGGYKVDNEQRQQPFAEAMAQFVGQLHRSGKGRLVPVSPAARPKAGA